ncbi:serine/threonine-protein kinase pakD [Drosophila kikkawai]|uniref:Serine/threonine-protein kinase pakD n=1 Tax=Drosophila kikkawai TaxID=30033 RepID=A0A6P4I1A4_DROKI|nr:uncharacterized protein LOC108074918 [Drosophila kikkawai]
MQRSSPFLVGKMVRGQLLGLASNWRDIRRCLASNPWSSSQSGGRGSRGGSSGDRSEGALSAGSGSDRSDQSETTKGTLARASATSMVMRDSSYYTRGVNQGSLERRINREDYMWHNRNHADTKWLNPHDPLAYRPNFSQTEPTIMKKQFMRSPDQVTREVLGRDWDEAVKTYRRSSKSNDTNDKIDWEEQQQQPQQQQNTLKLQHPSQQQQQKQHQYYQHWNAKPTQDQS